MILRTASRSGLTVALFSAACSASWARSIATLIFAATSIYYLVFEGSVIAVAAQTFIGGPLEALVRDRHRRDGPLVWKGVRIWLDQLERLACCPSTSSA